MPRTDSKLHVLSAADVEEGRENREERRKKKLGVVELEKKSMGEKRGDERDKKASVIGTRWANNPYITTSQGPQEIRNNTISFKITVLPENPAMPPDRNSSGLRVMRSICVATDPAYSSMIGQSWLVCVEELVRG